MSISARHLNAFKTNLFMFIVGTKTDQRRKGRQTNASKKHGAVVLDIPVLPFQAYGSNLSNL